MHSVQQLVIRRGKGEREQTEGPMAYKLAKKQGPSDWRTGESS